MLSSYCSSTYLLSCSQFRYEIYPTRIKRWPVKNIKKTFTDPTCLNFSQLISVATCQGKVREKQNFLQVLKFLSAFLHSAYISIIPFSKCFIISLTTVFSINCLMAIHLTKNWTLSEKNTICQGNMSGNFESTEIWTTLFLRTVVQALGTCQINVGSSLFFYLDNKNRSIVSVSELL